jgi:hypothetical protein
MNRKSVAVRLSALAALAVVAVAATDRATIAHQGSTGVEEVVALNNKYRKVETRLRRLADAPDFGILVENLPDELSGKVTKADVEKWIRAELTNSASTAVIVTDKEQDERLDSPGGNPTDARNLEGYIKRRDAAARFLYVRLSFLKTEDGVSFYDIAVEFNRIGVIPTGAGFCTVFSTGGYGTFGANAALGEKLRAAVTAQVKKFATAWTAANAAKE